MEGRVDYSRSPEAGIIDSWQRNALPWTQAVRAQSIESRRLVTDRAIVETVLARKPHTVIDVGCGEGWLIRALAGSGRALRLIGYDVVSTLIERAGAAGGGEFRLASYEAIAAGAPFAAGEGVSSASGVCMVCNFSLLGKESVGTLVSSVPRLLGAGGSLIVQTLHPVVACGELPYRDGWRPGSWAGFGTDFCDPAPWYFRTLDSWLELFRKAGLRLDTLREPLHPVSGQPVSVIFVAAVVR
jgi:SAM-dependent methyltransferase